MREDVGWWLWGEGGKGERKAGLGLCYSHAAYCHFYMFESLDVAGWCCGGGGGVGGGGVVGEGGDAKTALKFSDKNIRHYFFLFQVSAYFLSQKVP